MKKIILITSLFLLVFVGCEKQEQVQPKQESASLTIDIYGAYQGTIINNGSGFDYSNITEVDYSVIVTINGISQTIGVKNTLHYGFVGAIPVSTIEIKSYDKIKISIQSNNGYDYFYKSLRIYSDPANKTISEFKENITIDVNGKDFI